MEFERKDFTADKVKLYESVRQKMAKIYVHELSKFKPPNLERYSFMGRNDNYLDKIELEEKSNWVRDRKIHQNLTGTRIRRSERVVLEFFDDLEKFVGWLLCY